MCVSLQNVKIFCTQFIYGCSKMIKNPFIVKVTSGDAGQQHSAQCLPAKRTHVKHVAAHVSLNDLRGFAVSRGSMRSCDVCFLSATFRESASTPPPPPPPPRRLVKEVNLRLSVTDTSTQPCRGGPSRPLVQDSSLEKPELRDPKPTSRVWSPGRLSAAPGCFW